MERADLELEVQRTIFSYILENPGTYLRQMSRKLEIKLSTLRYHLNFLLKNELIVSRMESNLKVFFPVGNFVEADKGVVPLLRQKRFRDIILILLTFPGLTHSEMAYRCSMKPSTLSKYLGILTDRNILYSERTGKIKRFFIKDEKNILRLLLTYRRSFWDPFVDNMLEIYFDTES